jgi:hypothetical protein
MLFTPRHCPLSPRGMNGSPASAWFASPLRSLRLATAPTDIVSSPPPEAVFSKTNALLTDTTSGRFNRGRILQSLEVVLIGAKIYIELSCKRTTAGLTRLPLAVVAFVIVEATQREAAMVVVTAVSGIGKELIGMGVIANPLLTALGLGQPIAFATQTAAPARGDEREMTATHAGSGFSCGGHPLVSRMHHGLKARSCR